jgi:isopenicillin N synthase-like dioxygenase
MIIYTPPKPADHIPVVDLSGTFSDEEEPLKAVAWEIHKACRDTGFFYISNHGIREALIEAQFASAKRFFDLPLEDKLAVHLKRSKSAAGYAPIAAQALDSQDVNSKASPPDLKESFAFAEEVPDDHPFAAAGMRGFGNNQWPKALPDFREQMLEYQATMRKLGDHVLRLIAISLDLAPGHFAPFYDIPIPNTRLIKYPPQPLDAQFNQIGAGAHTDWGAITLLSQDSLGGLEVSNISGEWLEAKPLPGTFVVNLGDLMARWTNGLYKSTMHRVRNNRSNRDRYSVAFFYSPRPTALVTCLPTCTDENRPPQFRPCTVREHIDEMFRRSYGFKPGEARVGANAK